MEYPRNIQKLDFPCKIKFLFENMNMEYSMKNLLRENMNNFGIWNITRNIPKKTVHNRNIEKFGIWNIPGIFQKKRYTIKIWKILEYGIFHGIFLEYSKKSITTLGGVKFN